MDTCRDLLWPWPGVADDFTTIWAHIKSMGSNLWDLEFSAATDDLLAIARLLAAAGGRLWGWFALAAIIIGGLLGGVFGTACGLAGTGAGFLARATAVLALAAQVCLGLLVAPLATEALPLLQSVATTLDEDRTHQQKK